MLGFDNELFSTVVIDGLSSLCSLVIACGNESIKRADLSVYVEAVSIPNISAGKLHVKGCSCGDIFVFFSDRLGCGDITVNVVDRVAHINIRFFFLYPWRDFDAVNATNERNIFLPEDIYQ